MFCYTIERSRLLQDFSDIFRTAFKVKIPNRQDLEKPEKTCLVVQLLQEYLFSSPNFSPLLYYKGCSTK